MKRRGWLGRLIARAATWTAATIGVGSGYNVTNPRRKVLATGGRPGNATANELLTASLPQMRAWCRDLERNNPTARAGIEALVALVVGTGIALEPDTGDERVDALLREQWSDFARSATVDGCDLYAWQARTLREMVTAGESLSRLVVSPSLARQGEIPLRILLLEAEWLDETVGSGIAISADGSMQVGPIRYDKYGRPITFRIRHPDANNVGDAEEIPASEMLHVFERRRALQGRGEPWLSPVIETLQQERDLVDAELKAANNSASIGLAITSEHHDDTDTEEEGTSEDPAQNLRIGAVARLYPGEEVQSFTTTRPSQQIAPFRQMLRGDIAAALRIPQRFLDRDVSRANYSSMRADMLDTERLLAPVREWFGHATVGRLYREALPYLCARAGVPLPKRQAYRLVPDGQPYVDPKKDAEAAAFAIAAGLSTYETEVGKRGGDYRQIWQQRAKEQAEAEALGLALSQDAQPAAAPEPEPEQDNEEPAEAEQEDAA